MKTKKDLKPNEHSIMPTQPTDREANIGEASETGDDDEWRHCGQTVQTGL